MKFVTLQTNFKLKNITSLQDNFNLHYYANLLDDKTADKYFKILENELNYSIDFGNGRKMAILGDTNLNDKKIMSWNQTGNVYAVIKNIKHKVEKFTCLKFNSVVINRYNDGAQGIGFHSDRELDETANIAGVSLGCDRLFRMKPINFYPKNLPKTIDINLAPGSLYVIKYPTNNFWMHSVPKQLKIRKCRISLTFRLILNK